MQSSPNSFQNHPLCPAGEILEAKTSSNLEFLKCSLKKLDKRLEGIEGKIDDLNANSTKDFVKIESLSAFLADLKNWKSSVEQFQNAFAKHLSDHENLEVSHRRYSQNWGLFGGLSGASLLELILRGIHSLMH